MEHGYQRDRRDARRYVTKRWLNTYARTGHGWLMITSRSMHPLIKPGDLLHVEKIPVSAVNRGDIIVLWRGNRLIAHRLILKSGKDEQAYFIERPDRSPVYSNVPGQSLVGKVKSIKRQGSMFHMDNLRWRIINRTVGTIFFGTYRLRSISQKIDFVPHLIKDMIRKTLRSSRTLRERLLNYFLSRK